MAPQRANHARRGPRVFVGSTRPAKVDAVREALAAIAPIDRRFTNSIIQPRDVTDIAPRMPMDVAAIIDGAHARATAIWTLAGSDFAVGLEGGLAQLPRGQWALQSWTAVTDGVRWGYGGGPSLMLPEAVAERVVAGEELGDVIDELAAASVRGTRGAWGILTLDLIGRRDAFRAATIAAFAPFYNPAAWTSSKAPLTSGDGLLGRDGARPNGLNPSREARLNPAGDGRRPTRSRSPEK